jgi:hypothetical protein
MLDQILKRFDGSKTYVVAIVLVLVAGLDLAGLVPQDARDGLYAAATAALAATLRHGISKLPADEQAKTDRAVELVTRIREAWREEDAAQAAAEFQRSFAEQIPKTSPGPPQAQQARCPLQTRIVPLLLISLFIAPAALLAQEVAPPTTPVLDTQSGWVGTGLLSGVLSWLMFIHLPAKDKLMKELLTDFRASLTEVTDHCEKELKEISDTYRTETGRILEQLRSNRGG